MTDALRIEGLSRAFGRSAPAVNDVDLALAPGTFFCLLGPSGCGKTTLLRLIGGYLAPDRGRIFLTGDDVTHAPLERRNVGMVFQNYALFPHLTARGNVAFGVEARRVPRAEAAQRVEMVLDRVGLSATERDRRPRELSGGQQQRVALARALVIEPRLLLLDEPLANLDRQLREQLRTELKDIQLLTHVTTVFVTHDQEEALSLADRVGLMLAGRILQVDTPEGLYTRPRIPFVANFVGQANLLEILDVSKEQLQLRGGLILGNRDLGVIKKGSWILVRPENFAVGAAAERCPDCWAGPIVASTFLGADQLLRVAIAPGVEVGVRCRPGAMAGCAIGTTLTVGVPASAAWVIPENDPPWLAEHLAKEAGRAIS
jgi:ABC-type Fe3+/spermidine/putrescine transport system ATPase subunit